MPDRAIETIDHDGFPLAQLHSFGYASGALGEDQPLPVGASAQRIEITYPRDAHPEVDSSTPMVVFSAGTSDLD